MGLGPAGIQWNYWVPCKPVSCTEVRQRRRGSHQGTESFPFPISPRSVCHGLFLYFGYGSERKYSRRGDITGNVVIFCYERKCSITSLISSCIEASKINIGRLKSFIFVQLNRLSKYISTEAEFMNVQFRWGFCSGHNLESSQTWGFCIQWLHYKSVSNHFARGGGGGLGGSKLR